MLFFSGNSNIPLAKKIASEFNSSLSELEITLFPDNENRVRVVNSVLDEDTVVVQSTGIFPNLYYMELFFIIDSLKRSGAKTITLIIPYLGYQRQDHVFREGEGVSVEVIARILKNLGADRVISLDLHSIKIPELFEIPLQHLSAESIFASKINELNDEEITLVTPDMGGIRRIKQLSEMTNDSPYVSIEKDRDLYSGDVESTKINGRVGKTCIIFDDVISTGRTIVAAADLLKKNGAEKIIVMATHSILSDGAKDILEKSQVDKVYTTDTIDIPSNRLFPKLEILSVSSLISSSLK